jgi:putative FmdB family regulatory protein
LAGRNSVLPLYEYKCEKCGHRFEKIEKHSASEIKKCPKCGAHAPRQISAAGIQFKGSGWYVTDYAGKGSSPSSSEGDGASSKTDKQEKPGKSEKSESKSTDAKSSEKSSSEKSSSKKDKK